MSHQYAIQQQSFFSAYGEEVMMRSVAVSSREAVVCPKPRRVGQFNTAFNDTARPLRLQHSQHQETCDAKAANELLDIILAKSVNGGSTMEQQSASSAGQVASSPPFFCGSPPSRASNPLVQDSRFGDEKAIPISPSSIPIPSGLGSSPSSATRKGGCMRVNFRNNPAVRVEGFDCLDRDRRVGRIPALA
ncbi:hypothetical protein LIER_16463 [Lithospermum erythrorhizon]|uniref:Uncharacterized protein n=1 Tax=Lithospermum erythrorhizon TaxID=34254 RepID=A0AAV3Q6R0_LITER